MCIIIWDVHKFNCHCPIPLDPWLQNANKAQASNKVGMLNDEIKGKGKVQIVPL